MKHVKKSTIIILFVLSLFLLGTSLWSDVTPVVTALEKIEKEVNISLKKWQFSRDAKKWEKHWLRNTLDRDHFYLRTALQGNDIFAGVKVKQSPLVLKLKMYAAGYCDVTVKVDGKIAGTFTVDGSSGTGVEALQEISLTSKLAKKAYRVVLEVKNKGFKPFRTEFWPPRNSPLKEEGMGFRLIWARSHYPEAAEMYSLVNNWLLSMKTANALVNPDFRRFTFTGKPYNIPDKRKTPKERLELLNGALKKAVATFSLDALKKGKTRVLKASIHDSYQVADILRDYAKEFKVHLIGNAHIDIAWLWRIAETVMVAHNTYDTVVKNMGEYPELHYAQSQALTYAWIENQFPQLFEKIKGVFKTGKWEIVGGMWVEPDCNLISGESWVRQILYGKKYFKDKFGIDVKTGWNVDSFGYNWNMPQLYRKSGIDRFVTQKIWWNDTTVFPYYIFWWQGVDGTRLLSYFPPVGYTSRVQLDKVADNITKYEATTGYKKSLILYGIGDHGGGPNREILNRVREYGKLHIAPDFIHAPSRPFLENISTDLGEDIPVWKDELYLEYHRGTYTSQAAVKKGNRQSESRIAVAEKTAAVNYLLGGEYPAGKLEEAWKLILTNQFHDILPGSSIAPVYPDAQEFYDKAGSMIEKVQKTALQGMAKRIDTWKIKKGTPLVVFNSLSWKRSDFVTFKCPAVSPSGAMVLRDPTGKAVPAEISQGKVSFVARDIPAMGYRVYVLEPGRGTTVPAALSVKDHSMENNHYRLTLNPKTGNIKSFYDKKAARELVAPGKEANVLKIYEDRPENWDAWNIGYTGRMWELNQADSVEVVKTTPVRIVMKVKKSFLGFDKSRYSPTENFPSSFFTQYITLYNDLDRVDIRTQADWWESHMFLRASFPLDIKSDVGTYEIPYASIQRTTKFDTLWEKARFEVSALKWMDLSDAKGGLSLLNDSKYGCDIHGNVMNISLLRAPTWPDPMADRGKHTFVYSLYAHQGNWNQAATVQRGYELNTPLTVFTTQRHKGDLPREFSFFQVESPGVILDTVKQSEQGDALVLRFYESLGKAESATLKLFKTPVKVVETDLLEGNEKELKCSGGEILLELGKYEIKTLKVYFK